MKMLQEGTKTTAQQALDAALKGAVWRENAEGDYETIIPTRSAYLQNLGALAGLHGQADSPLLRYERVDGAVAHHITVRKETADAIHRPVLLSFDEAALPGHARNLTQSLLFLLNGNWHQEASITREDTPLLVTRMPAGEMARGTYAYLREALQRKPDAHGAGQWNGANVLYHDPKQSEVFVHLGPELSNALFGGGLEQLLKWRDAVRPHRQPIRATPPETVTAATNFAALHAHMPAPGARISQPSTPTRARPAKQLDLPF